MDFVKTADGSGLTVSLAGDLDSLNAPELEDRLKAELDGLKELIFDLAALEYVSSAGLRVFLSMQKTMKAQGNMEIVNVNDEVMDIFKVTGFVKLLNIK